MLLLNPGGPGGSELGFPAVLAEAGLPRSVLDAYDVIGFDPRGVGHSTPVTCDFTPEQTIRGTLPRCAHDTADVVETAEVATGMAEQCGGSRPRHCCPTSAPPTPHGTWTGSARRWASRGCPTSATRTGPTSARCTPRCSPGVATGSCSTPTWPRRPRRHGRAALRQGFPGPVPGLSSTPGTVSRRCRRSVPGRWACSTATPPGDNELAAFTHVICNDADWLESIRTYQRNVAVDRVRCPLVGAMSANVRPCAFWPTDPVEPPVRVGDRGPSNVLLTQFDRDPGTPLAGARLMRAALGDRARLVTVDQGGHGVYLFGRNTTFLVTGDRTSRDLHCAAETS